MAPNVSPAAAAAGLAVLALAALAALAVIARGGDFEETDWRLLGTLFAALFCGSSALAALRFAIPYRVLAAVPLAAFALLGLAIWSDEIWDNRTETIAKAVVSALALTLAVLLVAALRLQTPFTSARVWIAYVVVAALISFTALLALALLWSWDVPFLDEPDGEGRVSSEFVENVAVRVLLALFTLSVVAYLALPLVTRILTARSERDH